MFAICVPNIGLDRVVDVRGRINLRMVTTHRARINEEPVVRILSVLSQHLLQTEALSVRSRYRSARFQWVIEALRLYVLELGG
jgi:hypothetical protein